MSVLPGTSGALALPIPVPASGASVGDVALDVLKEYLRAFLVAYGGDAWAAVAPGEPIVREAYTHDPEEYDFDEKDLPALYLFRTGSAEAPKDLAEDWRISADTVRIFWVTPNEQQETQRLRAPFFAAVGKLIDEALDRGRDPCWIKSGDPDPSAAEEGSVLLRHAGLEKVDVASWNKIRLAIKMHDAASRPLYDAVDVKVTIVERSIPDEAGQALSTIGGPAQLDLAVALEDGSTFAEHLSLTAYGMLYVQDGAVAQVVNQAAAKLTAFDQVGPHAGVIPDHANDRITVSNAGPRLVTASFSVFGTAGRNVQLRLRKNDVEVAGLGCRLKFDGSGNLESASFAGIVDCDQSDVLTVWAEADVNGTSLTIVDAALTVSRAD